MLSINLYIMMISTRTSVNWTEWISLRGGFSIYSGWVTAATILNATFMLKNLGFKDPTIPRFDEEQISIAILAVAFAIYNAASYIELNPLYGSVFIWVIVAIRSNIVNNKSQYTDLEAVSSYLAIFQSISMTALWTLNFTAEQFKIDLGYYNRGLFYEIL